MCDGSTIDSLLMDPRPDAGDHGHDSDAMPSACVATMCAKVKFA